METMQPILKNGRNTWDRVNMPETEFRARVNRIRKTMQREKLDLLLLYGNGYDDYGNYSYVGNYVVRLARGALVALPVKGEPALIFEGASRGIPSVRKTTWIEEIRAGADAAKECIKYIEEKKLPRSTVGLIGTKSLMPWDQLQLIRDSLKGSKLLDVDPLLKEMRMIKSSREIDQVRRAARILSRASAALFETRFTNLDEKTVEGFLYREVRIEGAEDFRMLIAKPREEGWTLRPPEEGTLLDGEAIVLFLAVEFERYWAETVRTCIVKDGSVKPVEREDLNLCYSRLVALLQPGKPASQFHREAGALLRKEKLQTLTDYGLGQGIGLSPGEPPSLSGDDRTPLKEGMCVTVRLMVQDETQGAAVIGNTLLLTKKRAEILTV
jgi:Xaa-Pro aminopeptidase